MKLEKILSSKNITTILDEEKLDEIGQECLVGYKDDVDSRSGWIAQMENAMKLALQVMEPKNDPWPNASNVKFPLITIAAIQYHARVYPALISGPNIVKCRGIGEDPDGMKSERARRVSAHMSYQFLEQDENWESEMDKLFIGLPILGVMFKKTFFDPEKGHNVSYTILPHNLVVNYYATSIEDAERVTEITQISKRVFIEKQRLGIYRDCELVKAPAPMPTEAEIREGRTPPLGESPYTILEQHCYLDLDEDGYAEPYIVTLDSEQGKVLRIVPRFDADSIVPSVNKDEEVGKIIPDKYYTKYTFIPSPDGGFYELGFGALLGPINESINTILNQLIDAGKLANLPAGYLGRGARLAKGQQRFKPGELKDVNATGDDLRKNIMLLPFKEPSGTLFNLLNLLINYGERTSSVTDIMTGEMPGQNTPATTSVQQLEQSQKVFTGIYKRNYKDLTKEFRIAYDLNYKYLNPKEYFTVLDSGEDEEILQQDYAGDPTDIRPTADPTMASGQEKAAKAQAVRAASREGPGYNIYAVERRFLEALEIPNIDEILPDPQGPNAIQPQPDLAAEAKMLQAQAEADYKQRKIAIEEMLADGQLNDLYTRAVLNLAKAEAADDQIAIDAYRAQLEDIKQKREAVNGSKEPESRGSGSMENQPDNAGIPEVPPGLQGGDTGGELAQA